VNGEQPDRPGAATGHDLECRGRANGAMKAFLLVLGLLSAVLILGQLVMGQMIIYSGHLPRWTTTHRHSGYLTVVVSLVYIAVSLIVIATFPRREKP
jgi:hypothetical protein